MQYCYLDTLESIQPTMPTRGQGPRFDRCEAGVYNVRTDWKHILPVAVCPSAAHRSYVECTLNRMPPLSITLLWDALLRRWPPPAQCGAWIALLLWVAGTPAAIAQAGDLTLPSTIQGAGPVSPLLDEKVVTWGRVTGLTADGFFLQNPTGDGNPATSEALYVYTYRSPVAEFGVELGACVRVQGQVVEFYGKTELTRATVAQDGELCGNGGVAPAALPLLHPGDDPAVMWEPFEGMVVRLPMDDAVVQGPTKQFGSGEAEIALLPAGQQRYLGPVHLFHDQPASRALIFLSNRLGLVLPEVGWGETLQFPEAGLVGVLDYAFGKYQLLPFADQEITVGDTRLALDDESEPSASLEAAEYGVCSYNVHGLGRGTAQHTTDEAYAQALRRAATTIAGPLAGCTVLAIQETGRPADAGALAAMLAADHGLTYTALALEGPASGDAEFPLTNSILVDTTRVEVLEVQQIQACTAQDFGLDAPGVCPVGSYAVFDRPPLAAQVAIAGPWPERQYLWVVSNHWKSKSGDETANAQLRMAQALAVADEVTRLRAGDGGGAGVIPVIVAGDLNDFYAGPAVAALIAQTGLVQSHDWLMPLDRYTYIFNGAAQVLDHILIAPELAAQVALVEVLHIHADRPNAASDHDPVVLRLRPGGAANIGGTLGFGGIAVTAVAADGAELARSVTDARGFFRLWGLPPGSVQLVLDAPPWITLSVPALTVRVQPGYNGELDLPRVAHRGVTQSVWLAGATAHLFRPSPATSLP